MVDSVSSGKVSLLNFFIFNTEFGGEEGQEMEQIIYYHPADADNDTKIKNIGLVTALSTFIGTFKPKDPCECLTTEKTKQFYYNPEPHYWMVLTVSLPSQKKTEGDVVTTEYLTDSVENNVYLSLLKQAYTMFRFLNGKYSTILTTTDKPHLLLTARNYYNTHIQNMNLEKADLLDIFNGVFFAPVDKQTFLNVQCLVNHTENTFPLIKQSMFIYTDKIVWSGLNEEDTTAVYKYFNKLLSDQMTKELLTHNKPRSSGLHHGRFICGPESVISSSAGELGTIPRVYLRQGDEAYYLVVYSAHSAHMCLLLDGEEQMNYQWFKRLDGFLGRQLSTLASDIGESFANRGKTNEDPVYKYIYYNEMNSAQKTTMHVDIQKLGGGTTVPEELIPLLNTLHADVEKASNNCEIAVKTASDHWIICRHSHKRRFYVVLNQKINNLIEAMEEVQKINTTHFQDIFFIE